LLCPEFRKYNQEEELYHIVRFLLLHTIGNNKTKRGLHFKTRYTEDYTIKLEELIGKVSINMLKNIANQPLNPSGKKDKICSIFKYTTFFSKKNYFHNMKKGVPQFREYITDNHKTLKKPLNAIPNMFFEKIWDEANMTINTNLLDFEWNSKLEDGIWANPNSLFNDGPTKFQSHVKNFKFENGCKLDETILTILLSIYHKLGFMQENWLIDSSEKTGNLDDLISPRMQAITFVYLGTICELWNDHDCRNRMIQPEYKFKLYRNNFKKGQLYFSYIWG